MHTLWSGPGDERLPTLVREFGLADVAKKGESEIERLSSVRDWVHQRWRHDSWNTPAEYDSIAILRAAATGARFRCAEYSFVLADVYRALSWPSRVVRWQSDKGAHVVTEVRTHSTGAWVMMDGQFATHVTRDGVPLDALSVRDALRRGEHGSLVVRSGARGGAADPQKAYLGFLGDYTTTLMFARDLRYGRQFSELYVLTDMAPMPNTKPPYLSRARYIEVKSAAALYAEQPPKALGALSHE